MGFQDRSLQCSDCGATFTFSAKDQEFYATKGFTNDPKRCSNCRAQRQSSRSDSGAGRSQGARQMFPAVCSQCGKSTEVPFEPREGRPVYCSDCYTRVNK